MNKTVETLIVIQIQIESRRLIGLYKLSPIEINALKGCANIPKCIQNPFSSNLKIIALTHF